MPIYQIEAVATVRRIYCVEAPNTEEALRLVEEEGIPYHHEEDVTEAIENVSVVEVATVGPPA